MKNMILVVFVLMSVSLFSQEREWGDLEKNELTLNEIAPIWPGCETGNVSERENCFNKNLSAHIRSHFKYPAKEYKENIQGIVTVEFNINEEGGVDILDVSGPSTGLKDEAKRIILALPKMKPGMLAGKPRAIKYTVPFNFKTGK
jgi:protein TonB